MASTCMKPFQGTVMRVTKLDACGAPVHGSKSFVVTDGFVSVELKAQIEAATEYKVKGANDRFIINTTGRPQLQWYDVTLNFASVDPEAYSIMTGMPIVLDDAATPNSVGFRVDDGLFQDFALEVWTQLDGQACVGGNVAYGYLLLPWVTNAVLGDFTVQNQLIDFPISSARTKKGGAWGTGPFNVNKGMVDGLGHPLLTSIGANQHLDLHVTYLAPPTAQCGAQNLP